ncbi:zinc finger FYVE domain-containing protein 1-like isoform X3 [Lucilia cuprina]|uniref:zinc finger FYVE domain-containing protein 1-like isoform X3 n=1 Tax=Lucilia cuprina TaxID=7375 RepID=UPI001F06F150|nr:zinc finger FYVE domain-containing protein 1-like isoform X3 [Lucilia cuprina]
MFKIDNKQEGTPAIMEPYDSLTFYKEEALKPDVVSDADFKSITITSTDYDVTDNSTERSFLLMDGNEKLHISSPELFCKQLKCSNTAKIKVVTIFGNTGDGKSHTMNHAFFKGEEVFKTSPEQNSCTLGVYAAMQPELGVLCLDTEGLLSTSSQSNRRMRMLLKVLAISDIVIYRTRSERLHSDMYEFLGTASKAFCLHFSQALQSLSMQGSANLGPAVIVFHETRHTKPLQNSVEESAEEKMRESFARLNYDIKAFSSLRYVGIQTSSSGSTDYSKLIFALRCDLENTTVRSPRPPNVIFKAMHALNKKFSGEISEKSINPFPEQYFTCPILCASCNRRCQRSMGHDGESHLNSQPCQHQHQFENKVELCKSCYNNGREVIVTRLDGWTHCSINCPHCGEIARTFKYWNGTQDCEAIRTQTVHVWKDSNLLAKGPTHSGQMVLDKVSYVCEAFTNFSSQPTGALKEWCADKVAPKYWKPNNEIIYCFSCKKNFEKTGLRKHHCRGCGEGFCDACSQYRMPVPARKWFDYVRVCSDCRQQLLQQPDCMPGIMTANATTSSAGIIAEEDVTVRKCGETLYNTVSKVASAAIECTKEIIKDTARPDYWVPDAEAVRCHICKMQFGTAEELALAHVSLDTPQSPQKAFKGGDCKRHHCRKCGQGVCADCSKTRRPVPDRGWLDDVRVCDECVNDISTNVSPSNAAAAAANTILSSSSNINQSHQQQTTKSTLDDPLKTKVE